MKRFVLLLAGLILLASPAWAFQGSIGSGEQSTTTAVVNGACWLTAVQHITDGTNDCKVIIHDYSGAASGTVRYEVTVAGADNYGGRVWTYPKKMYNGIYATGSGTGCTYIIEYIQE